jgi:hypothetical protein
MTLETRTSPPLVDPVSFFVLLIVSDSERFPHCSTLMDEGIKIS